MGGAQTCDLEQLWEVYRESTLESFMKGQKYNDWKELSSAYQENQRSGMEDCVSL